MINDDNTIITYMDDEGNVVSEENATRINIIELDDDGNRVQEQYLTSEKPMTPEEADEYWSNYIKENNITVPESVPENEKTVEEMYSYLIGNQQNKR